mmetsp:Transcript_53859/g.114421  ORF Transcript_53859/g.114421 Transcript_53859/m.114421 type:complete len:396 (-) Transcript_53859:151-1338(-)|eukprot:CAMPEP_0172553824 /NCGR_PEP_ID=MMETSP1067-20121228/51875_1 /TAXON_ID=265564 ORGANISM="Thalassiosira punctigera, Strain Tpunct2005C2" /NCGR_SAMPLE_ID=MMETSP1067 /ASSEMBLY_ACC=CAM_ASM_000444 /LENGTH=395 /DNA_ID=CAMNT_0013342063 /DNA_START=31 /DNA_END=1218 /DNA_ORIENTATION=-
MARRRASVLVILAAALAGLILCASTINRRPSTAGSILRSSNAGDQNRRHLLSTLNLAQFVDPKSVSTRTDAPLEKRSAERPREQFMPVDHDTRSKCQIIYILGVEGATHHGFVPIVEALARNQVDPDTGLEYVVDTEPKSLKAGLFGWFSNGRIKKWGFEAIPEVDDPAFVQTVVRESCPDDGRKHVMIEWASFPSGQADDRRSYRVKRQHVWLTMTPDEIANTDEALQHPTNMNAFYQSYSPYVDIKFVVLHRPFLETIASHHEWDGGPEIHSNVIRGFMLMLRRFLDTHLYDLVNGSRLWSLVCVERIMAKNYDSEHDVKVARKRVLSYLTEFLRWPDGDCPHCFDEWRESTKNPEDVLGEENTKLLREHMTYLEGVWPPPGEEGIVEQQCDI